MQHRGEGGGGEVGEGGEEVKIPKPLERRGEEGRGLLR